MQLLAPLVPQVHVGRLGGEPRRLGERLFADSEEGDADSGVATPLAALLVDWGLAQYTSLRRASRRSDARRQALSSALRPRRCAGSP